MKKIFQNIIVGSGFSAFVLNKYLKKDFLVVTSTDELIKNYPERRNLTKYLKPLTKKFTSRGELKFKLKKSTLHDTLTHGGNTNLWGGVCNKAKIKNKITKLEDVMNFKKLCLQDTGSFSNISNLYQMQKKNHNDIFNSKYHFKKIIFGHLIKYKLVKRNLICLSIKKEKIEKFYCRNLILAVNFVQLIEILINSNVLKNKDNISLEEFKYETKINFNKSTVLNEKKNVILAYSLSGIIKHALGLQKNFDKILFDLFNYIPFYYYQIFYYKKKFAHFIFNKKDKSIEELIKKTDQNFGKSVHYFNMKINNIRVEKFLKKKSNNIFGISSPFLFKASPGPISNDLINSSIDLSKKLNK